MDPNDTVVSFSAVTRFMRNCSTPEADKELFRQEGSLHDLIANVENDRIFVLLDK